MIDQSINRGREVAGVGWGGHIRWCKHPTAIVIETQARLDGEMDHSCGASDVIFHVEELSIDFDFILPTKQVRGREDRDGTARHGTARHDRPP
jgi:hypothetical protein